MIAISIGIGVTVLTLLGFIYIPTKPIIETKYESEEELEEKEK